MLDPATLKRYVKKKIYNLTAEEIETQLIEECVGNIEEIPLEHRESGIYVDVMVVEWNYKAVEMMISCHQSYFDTTDENEHWNFICEELEKNGFFRFTPEECKIKWMELEEEYHKCITEDDREKFRFYNLMHMVLKESDKGELNFSVAK